MRSDDKHTHPRRAPLDGARWNFDRDGILDLPTLMRVLADGFDGVVDPKVIAQFSAGSIVIQIDWAACTITFSQMPARKN